MSSFLLEVCAFNVASCIIAEQAGAGRIELCAGASVGGTTPSYDVIREAKEKVAIPIYPIIRPRGGDFLYNANELAQMKLDIAACKDYGCEGIATGVHLANREIDADMMKRIVEWAYPMHVTCHRVFDRVPDAFTALETLIDCGCERILSSGLKDTAPEGAALLQQLVISAGTRIIIMPGAGVRSTNIIQLMADTGARQYHSSARLANTPGDMADEQELRKLVAAFA